MMSTDEDFSLIRDLPSPIAWQWRKMFSEDESLPLLRMFHCFETGLRFLVSVSVAEYLHSKHRTVDADDRILNQLKRATLHQLREIFATVAYTIPREDRFVPEFTDLVHAATDEPEANVSRIEASVSKLIMVRNAFVHGYSQTEADYWKEFNELLPELRSLLEALSFLSQYKLISVPREEGSAILLRGTDPECIDDYQNLVEDKMYLASREAEPLPLAPYMVDTHNQSVEEGENIVLFVSLADEDAGIYGDFRIAAHRRERWIENNDFSPSDLSEDEASTVQSSADFVADESCTLHEVDHDIPAETATELLQRGANSNVEALKHLLHDHLQADERKHLLDKLRSEGCQGSDDGILCEYCLEENPIDLLTKHFTEYQLLEIAREKEIEVDSNTDLAGITKKILGKLNFHIVGEPKGLGWAIRYVSNKQTELGFANDKDAVTGMVTPISTELERIMHCLIVFYGRYFYGEDYSRQFSVWSKDFGSQRMSLGSKWNLLTKLEKEVVADRDKKSKLREVFSGREYVIGPEALEKLGGFMPKRGDFSHFKDFMEGLGHSERKARLKDMIARTLVFLHHLEQNKIFPDLLMVQQSILDRFGRRYLKCIDDLGNTQKIFTDEDVDPTKHYFMYPMTNPVRIHPVLIQYQPAE